MGTQVQRPLRNDDSSDEIAASVQRPGVKKKKRFSSESDIIRDPPKGIIVKINIIALLIIKLEAPPIRTSKHAQ